MRSEKNLQVLPGSFEIQILSDCLSDEPNFQLSGQIGIAEIGDTFARDYEISGNLDLAYSN